MAAFVTTASAATLSAGRTARFAKATFNAVVNWNDERVTRKSLSKLSARELEDIGLSFGDIDRIASRSVR